MRFFLPNFIFGSWLDDRLTGSDRPDWVFAFGGDDRIRTKGGDDLVIAGKGDDDIDTGAGDDVIKAGKGDDTIRTGEGFDTVDGGKGFDTAVYDGGINDYDIDVNGRGNRVVVTSKTAADGGRDVLKKVEALHFSGDDYTLYLDGTNNAVLARDDSAESGENAGLGLAAAALLSNDQEFDGDTIGILSVDATSAAGATVTFDGATVSYDPGTLFDGLAAGETATDSFSYLAGDGQGGDDTATVTVTITGENDAPELSAETKVTVDENTTAIAAGISATDVDSDTIAFSLEGVDAGLFTIDAATGALAFAAAPDFEAPGDADGDNVYDVMVVASDGEGGSDSAGLSVTVRDVDEAPAIDARVNEFHYDNSGTDSGEFVEIRAAAGDDVSALRVELVNGSNGEVYRSTDVAGLTMTTDGTWDYYVWALPVNGIQNGAPDGIVLANGPEVIEFLSYEGSFTAADGAAAGRTSVDIGVSEPGVDAGLSLQREEDGSWSDPRAETPGAENVAAQPEIVITEIMQNPSAVADGSGEWFEVFNAGSATVDLNGWTIADNDSDSHVIDNGGPLLIAPGAYLVFGNNADMATNGGVAVDYSYGSGFFLANGADELVLTTPDLVEVDRVEWDGGPGFPDPAGASMALTDAALDNNVGANWITSDTPYGNGDLGTPGAENGDGSGGGAEELAIWQVQGNGFASPYETMQVTVDAIVTYTVGDGFFLQEEDADADGDATTSDGIFVFTGGGALPSLGDRVSVTGTVDEFFGETQIASVSDVTVISGGNPMPTPAQLLLGPDSTTADKEAVEGMYFELMSGTVDPITVITNFNFDRFGEIYVSAGNQYQPTQLFDAQTEAAEVQALLEDNLANRLKIDDGVGGSNPTEFAYVANTGPGDNGNGILDAGDDFTAEGPTLRLGAEFDDTASGVMRYAFGDYTMLVDGTLPIDPATNEGARQATPDDVGGTLQVGAFNVLNYFTTLDNGSGTVGPNDLDPRGATTGDDLVRQTTKIVEAMEASGIDVFALQEIENNGFGPGSASSTLAAALNSATGAGFAIVDPTGGAEYLGTDAISTSIMYDAGQVTLVDSASIVFGEGSAATTAALADDLAGLIGAGPFEDLQRSRPAVIATFDDQASGAEFTVASVHFKSKGASGLGALVEDAGDYLSANSGTLTPTEIGTIQDAIAALVADPNYDRGDGQGFWNAARTDAAQELYTFLTTSYGGGGVSDYLILGDFNAYTQEDPTQAIGGQADTVDLLAKYVGADAYSFVFDGQRGALDQVMGSTGIEDNVTGLAEWHINADEPDLLNYSSQFNDERFYSPDLFASSDHDPVIIGLDFSDTPMT